MKFKELGTGSIFNYRHTKDSWALSQGFDVEVRVGYDTRYAKIQGDKCKMLISEPGAKTFIEVWKIKKVS